MIEDKELGLKIAESPRDKLIQESLEATEKQIVGLELETEIKKEVLTILKRLAKKD
ncbi:hypothetical protein KKD70_05300 [Patescibacteria group bacterium]|nr:hypothetical protein [Patescibacteria group bacterium]